MLGANVDFTDSSLRTALYRACLDEQESIVKLLLQYRANPNQFVFSLNIYNSLCISVFVFYTFHCVAY